ncbi:citramalate synthase [Geitlerinema sp. PCC 9228]|jgi:2-isopropylmalate synthase|uniref:citramalate synthase n=1 Tax=Geitlerinema sp. PCC 9228 TaxID=111611 RepID=UPI0008F9A64F|nr:citramalate synthase [Geitlerinema sp. PCC 9228]
MIHTNHSTAEPANQVWIYDTTLRDGSQREGISLSLEDKIRIARKLDELGVHFIEGGWPGANPKDVQFFWRLQEEPLEHAELVAFCSTRHPKKIPAEDPKMQAILSAGTRWVTIFGKSWDLHVTEGLQTTLDENLRMIGDTIEYLRSQGRRVIYDAEHWFDGYQQNPEYALKTLQAAIAAGAEWLVFCDTNGGKLPHEIQQILTEVYDAIGTEAASAGIRYGIHTHNDSETAVANAIESVRGGVTMVQGTINGYGERCGNANLCALVPNLQLKLGYDCLSEQQLSHLTETSRYVSEVANLAPNEHAAFVGRSAFAHKGGIHVSAVQKNPLTYEHIRPEVVGNQRRIVISDQSGTSNILSKAKSFGIDLQSNTTASRELLNQLKKLENEGYQFEAAEASFELLMRGYLGQRQNFFELKEFYVHNHKQNSYTTSLATIKVAVGGKDIIEAAEGNGPVSALDAALRKALINVYPEISEYHLTDYKVRILDSASGTSATTRVLVESSNGETRWTTVGVSGNIIDASYQAVVEGLEYGLMLQKASQPASPAES